MHWHTSGAEGKGVWQTLRGMVGSGCDRRTTCQAFEEQWQSGSADPRRFELPGEEVILHKKGDQLIIEPTRPRSLLAVLATLASLEEDFPPIPDSILDPTHS